jgi:Kef-type K+ transport system membrane component KefB
VYHSLQSLLQIVDKKESREQAELQASNAAAFVQDWMANIMLDVYKTWKPLQLIQTLQPTLTHAAIAMFSSALGRSPSLGTPVVRLANRQAQRNDVIRILMVMYQQQKWRRGSCMVGQR